MNVKPTYFNNYNSYAVSRNIDISFQANKVETLNVLKKKFFSTVYVPKQANLVKLNLDSKEDIAVLKNLKRSWGGFASNIYSDVVINKCADSVFALTRQEDSFEKLQPKKILGLAEVVNITSDKISLEYLQVKPKYAYEEGRLREYKRIGGALVNFLKAQNNVKKIQVSPTYSSLDFYEKHGFSVSTVDDLCNEGLLIWGK